MQAEKEYSLKKAVVVEDCCGRIEACFSRKEKKSDMEVAQRSKQKSMGMEMVMKKRCQKQEKRREQSFVTNR